MRTHFRPWPVLLILLYSIVCLVPATGQVIYVDVNATGANNGTSWADAYTDLQLAILETGSDDIWVAAGTYKPVECNPCTQDDRERFFLLERNQGLFGGFAGGETALNQRDIQNNPTILSGDIGTIGDNADNSFQIVRAEDVQRTSILDGFIIEKGNANAGTTVNGRRFLGGGLFVQGINGRAASPAIRNCTFRENNAVGGAAFWIDCQGGGIARGIFENCTFEDNTASLTGTPFRAGVGNVSGNNGAILETEFVNCIFRNNQSGEAGGALTFSGTSNLATAITQMNLQLEGCTFEGNQAGLEGEKDTDEGGGAIWYRSAGFTESASRFRDCRFLNNSSEGPEGWGGAVYMETLNDGTISDNLFVNCYFSGNSSSRGGGAILFRAGNQSANNDQVVNTLFYQNSAQENGAGVYFSTTAPNSGQGGTINTELINCSFYGNEADGNGGAFFNNGTAGTSAPGVFNTILWGDLAGGQPNEIGTNGGSVNLGHSILEGALPTGVTDAGNNIFEDPQYVDPENADLHLLGCSPGLNGGDNSKVPLPFADPDPDGDPRIFEDTVDIGAYEASLIYVDQDATGNNSGRSWSNAFVRFEDALAKAYGGDHIWVADGVYKPSACGTCGVNDRAESFQVLDGVEVYGGFQGDETEVEQRDWLANLTILSGNIGQAYNLDNSFCVVTMENVTQKTILNGFIIEGGNADGVFTIGGGLNVDGSRGEKASPIIENCTFRDNNAFEGGGFGINVQEGGRAEGLFRNCIFENNTVTSQGNAKGGAGLLSGDQGAIISTQFIQCTFRNNTSANDGGALWVGVDNSEAGLPATLNLRIDSCLFENNEAGILAAGNGFGGAIWFQAGRNTTSNAFVGNTTFQGNQVDGVGGGLFIQANQANTTLENLILNCVFTQNNSSDHGGGIFLRGAEGGSHNVRIINTVFDRNISDNAGGGIFLTSSTPTGGDLSATITNCSFSGNEALSEGAGLFNEGSAGTSLLTLNNSIFWGNTVGGNPNAINSDGGSASVAYSIVEGGIPAGLTDGGNNLNEDPQFADPGSGNLRLAGCSPGINAGNNGVVPIEADPDPDGDARIYEGVVDLGAYEASIIFVNEVAAGSDHGRSWEDAFTDLGAALQLAGAGDQVWVAAGSYRPSDCVNCLQADREETFLLRDGTSLYGGFSGNETTLDQRDWQANPTILSGNIGNLNDSLDNSYRVLTITSACTNTQIDGFTIEGGNANGTAATGTPEIGGGVFLDGTLRNEISPTFTNCFIQNNYAQGGGGVALNVELGGASNPVFHSCIFQNNSASQEAITSSGAAFFITGEQGAKVFPQLIGCSFIGNICGNEGGAIGASMGNAGGILAFEIDSCLFENNQAEDRGGAIWYRIRVNAEGRTVIKNSRFINNRSGGQGGAIYANSTIDGIANDSIVNSLFDGNQALGTSGQGNPGAGGALFIRGSQGGQFNLLTANTVFAENLASGFGGAVATTSIVETPGNLNTDFVNCTFYENQTEAEGGAIHADGSQGQNFLDLINSIFWSNSAEAANNEIGNNAATIQSVNNLFSGGLPTDITSLGTALFEDPQFLDPENGDFRLSACSPARDAGDSGLLPADAPDVDQDNDLLEPIDIDLRGGPRVVGPAVDLGAFEWNNDPPELELTVEFVDVSCGGAGDGSIEISASGGVPDYNIQWADGSTDSIRTGLSGGVYYFTATDASRCSIQDSVEIQESDPLLVNTVADTAVCAGESFDLAATASGGEGQYVYSWNSGLGNGSLRTITPDTTLLYRVMVTDAANCTAADSVLIAVNQLPQPMLPDSQRFCTGGAAELDAGIFNQYAWSTGDTTQMLSVNVPGIYTLTATDLNGCQNVASVEVFQTEQLNPAIVGSLFICPDTTSTLSVGTFDSYLWSTGEITPEIVVTTAGTYTIEVSEPGGCFGADTLVVAQGENPLPTVSGNDVFCTGLSTVLDAGAFAAYTWSTGDTSQTLTVREAGIYAVQVLNEQGCAGMASLEVTEIAQLSPEIVGDRVFCSDSVSILDAGPFNRFEWSDGSENQTLEVNESGIYQVIVFDESGCSGTDTIQVTRQAPLAPTILGDTLICEGETTTLSVTGFPTYQWSTSATTNSIEVGTGGTFSVTVTDPLGCVGSSTVEVRQIEAPQAFISASETEVCEGSPVALFADGVGEFTWIGESPESINILSPEEAEVFPTATGSTFTLLASNACGADSATISFTVLPLPQLTVGASLDTIREGLTTQLNASGATTYRWRGPELSCQLCPDPMASPEQTATYQIEGTDERGCTATEFLEIVVLGGEELCNIPLINVITPNGDGVNDVLFLEQISGFSDTKLTIFNRWGSTVFETFDYQNDWDGTLDGKPLPAGTYLYVLSLRSGPQRCNLSSTVTIIRP